MNTNKYSQIDIFFLILLPIAATVLILLLPLNLLVATLLYFGLPSLYISLRNRSIILRSLIFATTFTVISVLTDYLAERDKSWTSTSIFHARLAGVVPIEALVWLFLFTYLIIAYFQFFYDHKPHKSIGKRMPYLFIAMFAVIAWLCLTVMVDSSSFVINYFYIKFGLLFILLPLLAFTLYFPQYLRIFLKTTPYFFALSLVNVLVSLQKGHWAYPGHHFIGWVNIGTYRFPVEELIFWMILYCPFLISQFEFFNNDHLKFKRNLRFRSKQT